MWKIFLVLAIGFAIGFLGLLKEKYIKLNCRLQTLWLMLLIFCMGVSIGRNGEVIRNLPALGGKALLFAILAVIGSILFVFLLSKLFFEKEGAK
ncbi:LysO family transporter [Anaerotignum propionicum]|uniref:LysO family transporter n=1 Tax=Anaerotignum propionicum TaxID=28446 RepID=UPI00210D5B01|nr:LysO family transporter [Anaerotignum propionicum]MCQ4936115.1 lysine exporter LysO family protein [Anaerotignum propionicum]